jgi:response regulator RpfG family c-di-GMP phosphodiesterase
MAGTIAEKATTASLGSQGMTRQQRILIVDDTPQNLTLLAERLQPLDQVRVANNGERVLEVLEKQPFSDLILLDVMMPGMSGYEVLERIRAAPETASIPDALLLKPGRLPDAEMAIMPTHAQIGAEPIRCAMKTRLAEANA